MKNIYDRYFFAFIISILVTFFCVRPLNSPWHPFIAGDGLGYYSYLPAQYIYHDSELNFKWFNKAYNENYIINTFDTPEENMMVPFGNKKINKYYPGLSFLWMPFFFLAHIISFITGFSVNGYSLPYQLSIGFASLFYLIIGMIYLRKFLLFLFKNEFAALLVTISIYYGTYLFSYATGYNSASHTYSFTFIICFLYFSCRAFEFSEERFFTMLMALFCFLIIVFIRPFDLISILLMLAFIKFKKIKGFFNFEKIQIKHWVVILLCISLLVYQFRIIFVQTGSFFPFTYSGEKFYFSESRLSSVFFSYYMGLFVYAPITFFSLAGIPFMELRKKIILPVFFMVVSFILSSWWYWIIPKRALIDFYVIPAILLTAYVAILSNKTQKIISVTIIGLCIVYFQFKEMQMRRGILNEYNTYGDVFWRNFFRTDKANMYLVPPESILKTETHYENFEAKKEGLNISKTLCHEGSQSLMLDTKNYFSSIAEFSFPKIFTGNQRQKIRFSFWINFEQGIKSCHTFIMFYDRIHKKILEIPFYLNPEDIFPDKWDYKEFGYDMVDTDSIIKNAVSNVSIVIWNVEAKKNIYVDDLKVEFLVTDNSYETILK